MSKMSRPVTNEAVELGELEEDASVLPYMSEQRMEI